MGNYLGLKSVKVLRTPGDVADAYYAKSRRTIVRVDVPPPEVTPEDDDRLFRVSDMEAAGVPKKTTSKKAKTPKKKVSKKTKVSSAK